MKNRQESPFEVLIEGFDEWRRDHSKRTLQLDLLSCRGQKEDMFLWRFGPGQLGEMLFFLGFSMFFLLGSLIPLTFRVLEKGRQLQHFFPCVHSFISWSQRFLQYNQWQYFRDSTKNEEGTISLSQAVPCRGRDYTYIIHPDDQYIKLCPCTTRHLPTTQLTFNFGWIDLSIVGTGVKSSNVSHIPFVHLEADAGRMEHHGAPSCSCFCRILHIQSESMTMCNCRFGIAD